MNTNQTPNAATLPTPEPPTITRLADPLDWTVVYNAMSGKAMVVFRTSSMEQQPEGRVVWLHRGGKRIGSVPHDAVIKQTCRTESLVALANGAREI